MATPITEAEWLQHAQAALRDFGLPEAQVSWLAYTHNAVFDVRTDAAHYTLRLSPTHAPTNPAEDIWLTAIREHGTLTVPFLLQKRVTDTYSARLFSYIEGDTRAQADLSGRDVEQIGRLLARLHNVPVTTPIPNALRLDAAGLFGGATGAYTLSDAASLFSANQLATMQQVQERVSAAMDSLGEATPYFGLIHGDLLLKNILFYGDEVRALDFEYCGYGYYMYDLAPLLWLLKPDARYAEWADALWLGYTSVRPMPSRKLLETFIAARQVASLRWVAANQHNPAYVGKVAGIIQQRTAELEGFLATGVLRRG